MSALDNLTDGEIRVRLAQLGYPVGPITATTRKVLLKKLKHLEDGKSPGSRPSLIKYSSEEESEDGDATSSPRSRRSMPPPPPKNVQKPTVKRRSLGRRTQDFEAGSNNLLDDTVNSDFYQPSASSTINSSEVLSGSQSKKYSPKNITSPSNHNVSSDNHKRNHSPFTSDYQSMFRGRKSQERYDTESDTDGLDDIEGKLRTSPTKSNAFSSFFPTQSGLSQTRSRFQPPGAGSSSDDGPRFSAKSGTTTDSNILNSPFSSDFVRRLTSTTKSGLPSRLLDVKESDDEDTSSPPTYSHQNIGNFRRGTTSSSEGKDWKNATTLSMVVLFVVAVFFCVVGVMYLNVRFKETPITTTATNLPICKLGEKPGANCILDSEVRPAMRMFREVYEVLNDRAVQFACGSTLDSPGLNEDQITQILVDKSQTSVWEIEKHIGNIRVLIDANPQWGLEMKQSGIVRQYAVSTPNLPLGCYIYSLFFGIVGSALRLFVVVAALLGIGKGVYWWMDQQERSRKEVFKIVESIIDILSMHQQSSSGDNYLAISHVRDQLIPPQQRDKMSSIWEKAVAYLEENDSRVRTEVQQVAGEEFRVWRWLPGPRPNGKRKVWQGQAFETMEGSVNSLSVSPTPCLKIRHMFDSDVEVGEDWITRVQDAILEKCEGVIVLHIAVDKNSHEGCVYVKCASPQDAGRAYRALHGSWFDSKLVTVKYLRLERYHERFPEAIRALRPLRPSNDRKLSLQ